MLDSTESFNPSPAAIAAKITKTAALQAITIKVSGLRKRHADICERIRASIAANYGFGDDRGGNEMRALVKERDELQDRMRPDLVRLRELRLEHSRKVDAALATTRRAAALRLLSAVAEARAAIAVLDESTMAVSASGGDDLGQPLLTFTVAALLGWPLGGCGESMRSQANDVRSWLRQYLWRDFATDRHAGHSRTHSARRIQVAGFAD